MTAWRRAARGAVLALLVLGAGAARAAGGDTAAPAALVLVASAAQAHALVATHGLDVVDSWPLQALDAYCLAIGTNGAAADASFAALLARLRASPGVLEAAPVRDHVVTGTPAPGALEDPYYDLQRRTRGAGIAAVLRNANGRGVRIAILDTGVDLNHPDLAGQVAGATNFVGGDPALIPPEFHGTAVAGLIAAVPGNGIGIHGLAPAAELFALRACWEPSYAYGLCRTDTLAKALDYAIDIRARIINLSLAGPDDPVLTRLVERAIELGAVVLGAVGEEPEMRFPAAIPGVLAVAQHAPTAPPVLPPGPSFAVTTLQLLTTVPGARYDFVSGPSFVTAHASGLAAVLLEQEPHLRAAALAARLQQAHDRQPAR
ncbi:MAG: S8 family serine peptidase [Gammaproteobacteria bacterium]